MAETIKIGGELESVATGSVVAAASAIKDKEKDKYQSEINQEVDQSLADRYTKDKVYTKQQTDAQIEAQVVNVATREKYATLSATAEDVSIDTILPPAGAEDTIYRVANWDGTEYDTSYWSEYAWVQDSDITGHYVILAIKNIGLDTTPTPESLNPVSSGGVADACGYLDNNPEYIKVETDADGKILHSVSKEDGAYWFHKLKSPTLDGMMEDMEEIKGEAEAAVEQAIEDSQEELAAHYDYYNVSKHHSVRDVVNVYTADEGWEQIEYDSSLAQYDELDIYQVGETCNFGGDTEHSYEATISQRGVAPATITQEYVTRTKFTLEEALAVLPAAVISAFAAGQKICFVDLDDFIEEWQITEVGTWERINPYGVIDPEGRLEIKLDAENKIIAYRKTDGTWVECVGIEAPNLGEYVEKEEGKGLINADYAEGVYTINDPEERLSLELDSEERVISERDKEGILHENAGIKTNSLQLTEDGMTKFLQALKDSGFSGGTGDWSDADTLQIPEPRLALVNITNSTNDALMPVTKSNKPLIMQFWDMAGNYFRKNILIGVQGDTSTWMAKKNFGFDLCNDDWEGEDTFGLKIGNWVEQDSFHLKAGANDAFHGLLPIMYKWCELAIKKFDARPDRFAHGDGNQTIVAATTGSLDKDFGTGALCHPDGFPCIVYLNGEFYGVYSWQLKKHRANYFMDKKDYESIHLDGFVGPTFFGGTIQWNAPGIEIKNPKTLYCMDGTKYDDDNGKELIDSTSPYYDPNNKDHKNTVKAKNTIIAMSQALSLVYAEEGAAAQKAKFEELFDKDAIETLYLMNAAMCNSDSVIKNTQWLYYKDCKIVPAFYDLDGAFGHTITGQFITGNIFTPTSFNVANYPLKFVYDNYKDELDAKWKILRDSGIVSVETVKDLIYDWINRIGYEFYKKENKKWPCPSFRESHINDDYWEPANGSGWTIYNDATQYNVGDLVSMDNWEYAIKYRCKQSCVGEPPCTELYDGNPVSGGCFETPQRLLNNVIAQIEHLDEYFNYNI